MDIRAFRAGAPEKALEDLRERLARTRWPEEAGDDGWESGPPVSYLRALAEYWRDGFDWRRVEERVNAVPNFVATIARFQLGDGEAPMIWAQTDTTASRFWPPRYFAHTGRWAETQPTSRGNNLRRASWCI